ncbi:MAG: 4a-hydroxytetrahydrobiopterin dehydratase [Bacteroidota bacterium]
MTDLHQMNCVTPHKGDPALSEGEIDTLRTRVPEWQIREVDGEKRLERVFKFKNFAEALEFTNKVGLIAEEQDHHPMLITEYGRVTVNWWTHVTGGLHQNDFIMAAKTDKL